MQGRVLWFDVKKGFGFIRTPDSQDVFVHFSKIDSPPGEFRVLEQGERVEFDLFYADRGNGATKPQAKNVKRIGGLNDGVEDKRYTDTSDFRRSDDESEENQIAGRV